MKTVHHNSIEAYQHLNLSERQNEVLAALSELQEASDLLIAAHIHRPINQVTGRLSELLELGLVFEHHNIIGSHGRQNRVCRLVENFKTTLVDVSIWREKKKEKVRVSKQFTLSDAAKMLSAARGRKQHNTKQGLLFAGV